MNTHPRLIPSCHWIAPGLTVADDGLPTVFTLQDAFNYHGYDSVGGVVLGFRLLQRAISLLVREGELLERRELALFTAFPGLGMRDVMELVNRIVTENRFTLDTGFTHSAAPQGIAGSFYFRFDYRGNSVALAPVAGQPPAEFFALGRASKGADATPDTLRQWTDAKFRLANILLAMNALDAVQVL